MRKTIFIFLLTVFLYSCNNEKTSSSTTDTASKKEEAKVDNNLTMPYTAVYSSQFTIGDQKNAQTLLTLFKQWDDNKLKDGMNMFADSVDFYTNGWEFHGNRDLFFTESQKQRDMYSEVKTAVHAWIPAHSVDKNEDWVLIWSTAYTKDKAGKADSLNYQDTWKFNKEGKIDLAYQFTSHAPKPAKK
ncbi:MAG: hypothetical protein ACM3H8_11340 [Sphingobacteriales bacterium]